MAAQGLVNVQFYDAAVGYENSRSRAASALLIGKSGKPLASHPVLAAEELLRFARIRQLFQQ